MLFYCVCLFTDSTKELDYDCIMDRFRGRLVVPILDATGKHILGFGGRLLPTFNNNKAPKYINSPDSPVFQKKNVLFGQHLASQRQQASARPDPLVLVEGYMDAVALWSVGYESVVATMGTSISPDQLQAAAAACGHNQIILLLDNDEAGTAAVERLCRNGFLLQLQQNQQPMTPVAVATLPPRNKDPADFCEERLAKGSNKARVVQAFRTQVVENAVDWVDWFLHRLVGTYNATAETSFASLFEEVANVLASLPDRTQHAPTVAESLARVLGNHSSDEVRLQLESDLMDLASRIAGARDAQDRQISSPMVMAALGRGTGPDYDESLKLARNATNIKNLGGHLAAGDLTGSDSRRASKRRFRPRNKRSPQTLTPHFAGFEFAHQSDADWLGVSKRRVRSFVQERVLVPPTITHSSASLLAHSGSAKATLWWAGRLQTWNGGERWRKVWTTVMIH